MNELAKGINLAEAKPTRRFVVKKGTIAAGIIAGGGILAASLLPSVTTPSINPDSQGPSNPQTTVDKIADLKKKESEVARVIAVTDAAMELYEAHLTPRFDREDPVLIAALFSPLEYYQRNRRENPLRNPYTSLIRELTTNETTASQAYTDPYFQITTFEASQLSIPSVVKAGFFPSSRTLMLRDSILRTNLLDASMVKHEVVHAWQDNDMRSQHDPSAKQRYLDFISLPGIGIKVISLEYRAFAVQIEALKLLTDGRFKNDALKLGSVDINWYMKQLAFRSDQAMTFESFVHIANAYFGSNSNIDTYNKAYTDFLNWTYSNGGRETLYKITNPSTFELEEISPS